MRRLWTEPVVDFKGKWVKFETARLDPKPIQKPHVPIIVGGYAEAAYRRAVQFGAGWYGFNRDPAGAQENLRQLDAAFAKAGRRRPADFEIIITPPASMATDAMEGYGQLGVHRLVVNLGGQRPSLPAAVSARGRGSIRRRVGESPGPSLSRHHGHDVAPVRRSHPCRAGQEALRRPAVHARDGGGDGRFLRRGAPVTGFPAAVRAKPRTVSPDVCLAVACPVTPTGSRSPIPRPPV